MISFFPDYFLIQEIPRKRMIGKGKRLEDLYIFYINDVMMSTSVSVAHINKISAKLWHNRLGHISNKCLDALRSQIHCLDKYPSHDPCCIYSLAKQMTIVSHNNRSISAFDLTHYDMGSIPP